MPKYKFHPEMYVSIYQLAKQGLSIHAIAQGIGVDKRTLRAWRERRPAIADAIARGREGSLVRPGQSETFIDFIFKRLPPKIKRIWDQLSAWEKETNCEKKIEALLAQQGKRVRQHLFIHALINSNWNASEACRRVCIAKVTYEKWAQEDTNFIELLDELKWHKKNWIEAGLLDMVGKSEAATIFVNRTQNRDRGYEPKQIIEHNGSITHGHVDVMALLDKISVDAKREILAAIRQENKSITDKKPNVTVTKITTDIGTEDENFSE
jgi:hypothetical protein